VRVTRLNLCAAVLAGAAGLLAVAGWLNGTRLLVIPVLVAAALSVTRVPGGRLRWLLRGHDAGAIALRRTLPPVVLGIPAMTVVHVEGEDRYWHNEHIAEAFFAMVIVTVVCALLFGVAASLRVVDEQRENARRDLVELNAQLSDRVGEASAALRSAQSRIGALEDSQRAVLTVHDDVLQTIYASGLMLRTRIETGRDEAADDPLGERTLECLDAAVRAIRVVVEDLNDNLDAT
jgi:hypothetical protein